MTRKTQLVKGALKTKNPGDKAGLWFDFAFMPTGFFCVIEGIDGSGKTSLINSLRDRFMEKGLKADFGSAFSDYSFLCEPTFGPTGRRIREHLKRGDRMERQKWLDLFYTDRTVNVEQNILPALKRGELVFQDRYYFSTAAYQGERSSSPKAKDIVRASEKAGFPQPHLIVYLDLPPIEAMARIQKSRQGKETFEHQKTLEQIHENYKQILDPNFLRLDTSILGEDTILRLDATRPIQSHIRAIFYCIYRYLVLTQERPKV